MALTETSPRPKLPLRERLKALFAEYGAVALWVYFGIFALVLVGFALAIQFGANVESAAGTVGTWGAAYLATKLTQPLRIAATFVVTPLLVNLVRRRKGAQTTPDAAPELPEPGSKRT